MSENLIPIMFYVLVGVITVLALLLARVLPMLHDSVSKNNMMPIYQVLLQIAGPPAQTGLMMVGDALEDRAKQTLTPMDDPAAAYLNKLFQDWAKQIPVGQMQPVTTKKPVVPPKPVETKTDKPKPVDVVSQALRMSQEGATPTQEKPKRQ